MGVAVRQSNTFIKKIGEAEIYRMGLPLGLFFVIVPRDDKPGLATCSYFHDWEAAENYANSLLKPTGEEWWQK